MSEPESSHHRRHHHHKKHKPQEPNPELVPSTSTAPPPQNVKKRKKKRPTAKEAVAMPQSWVDCKLVITVWLLVTFLIFGLCIVTIPIGCILAVIASVHYFQRKGTSEAYAGKHSARVIYWLAFGAWAYDMIIFTLLMLAWVILVFSTCEDFDHNVCRFRKSLGYFGSAQMCMIFLHAVASFAAYISVRDCYVDICLEEREEKERFNDMEKQIFEEFRQKQKDEHTKKTKKKKKSSSKTHTKHKAEEV